MKSIASPGLAPSSATAPVAAKGGHNQALRYLLIGGAASAIDVLTCLLLFNVLHTTEFMAHSISVPLAVIFSFVVNARHNFKTVDYALLRFVSFCIVCAIGWAVGYGVIMLTQQLLGSAPMITNIGKLLSLPVVFVVQFLLNSKITFRNSKKAA